MSYLNVLMMKPTWFHLRFKTLLFWTLLMVVGSIFKSIRTFDKIAEDYPATKECDIKNYSTTFSQYF